MLPNIIMSSKSKSKSKRSALITLVLLIVPVYINLDKLYRDSDPFSKMLTRANSIFYSRVVLLTTKSVSRTYTD